MNYHRQLIQTIRLLTCTNAETTSPSEKKTIQELLDQELGIENADRIIRRAILQALQERYQSHSSKNDIAPDRRAKRAVVANLYQEAIVRFHEEGIV